MAEINSDYFCIDREYIFPIIEKKLAEHHRPTINLGIGDISLPLAPTIAHAIRNAVDEMTKGTGLHGYGPSLGYDFLRTQIASELYNGIEPDEIFISEGANTDLANILDLFSNDNRIALPDPTYPVYLDSSIMAGYKDKITLLPCTGETNFLPMPPEQHCDIIFLCSPSNPTGQALTRTQLASWISYAQEHHAILIIDCAYRCFIRSEDVPQSIYELPGAKEVAIEINTFSKSAGFTGLRCGWSVFPKTVRAKLKEQNISLHQMWKQRQNTKSNGVSYPIQRGAQAALSKQGLVETRAQIAQYQQSSETLLNELTAMGQRCFGGENAPYVWWQVPQGHSSWSFFDYLLDQCNLITIPGCGFGHQGEGYIRLSGFTKPETTIKALEAIKSLNLNLSSH